MNSFLLSVPQDAMAAMCLLVALLSMIGMVWLCIINSDFGDDMQEGMHIDTDEQGGDLLKYLPLKRDTAAD